MPPPVAPFALPKKVSFQAISLKLEPTMLPTVVPPHDVIHGSLPGYWTWALPSPTLESEPVSPEAMSTVIPSAAASLKAALTALISAVVTPSPVWVVASSPLVMYQLIEITDGTGSPAFGWTARVIASTQPCCVPGAK